MDNISEENRKSYRRPAFLAEFVEKYGPDTKQTYKIPYKEDERKVPAKRTIPLEWHLDSGSTGILYQILREGSYGDIQQAFASLGQGVWPHVNKIDEDDEFAPLHVAVRRGNGFATEQLLSHGADINLLTEDGKQSIHLAAKHYKQATHGSHINNGVQFSTIHEKSCLKVLLESGANVNAKDKFQSTPLHYASDRGHLHAVQLLIETGKADLLAKDDHLSTALHEAAKRGHTEILAAILENSNHRPKLLEAKDENGCTPLILSCRDGYTKVAEEILNSARKSNASASISRLLDQDNDLSTPLHAAIDSGCLDTVLYLLATWEKEASQIQSRYDILSKVEFSNYVDKKCGSGKTSLHSAAEGGVVEIVQAILDNKADVNSRNDEKATPLWIAAHRNHLEVAKILVDRGANLELQNNESLTPLMVACREGNIDMMEMLHSRGANLSGCDAWDRNCCLLAAQYGRTAIVQALMGFPCAKSLIESCDRLGNTALHAAAATGGLAIVKILISEGASLDQRNDKERTPLHVAALNGRLNVVQEIVNMDRSSLNDQDEHSMTPLHLAALNGHTSTVKVLLMLGANSQDTDGKGQTALDICINEGWTKSAKILIETDHRLVYNQTRNMSTPLHTACEKGHVELVKLLLAAKADVKSTLPDGRNPLDVAVDNYNESCARALLEDDSWKDSLRNAYFAPSSKAITTPLRNLVDKMPDVAELALTKCMSWNDVRCDDKDYTITFTYEFLEDAYESSTWMRTLKKEASGQPNNAYLENESFELNYVVPNGSNERGPSQLTSSNEIEKQPYSKDGALISENHILNKMKDSRHERLLRHPTVTSLLNWKWRKFGRYIYWLNVFTYLAFFVCLNVYMTTTPPRFAVNVTATTATVQSGNKCLVIVSQAQDVWGSSCKETSNYRYLFIVLVLAFSSIQLIKELFQMIHQKSKYFLDYTNYIEATLYILCILVFVDIDPLAHDTGIREKWQWECGAFAILLSWLNLLLYARRTSWLGIYVFMVTSVGFTFLRFATVLVFFIFGFAFSFYVLLQNQECAEHNYPKWSAVFKNRGQRSWIFSILITAILFLTFVKTFVMMIGEMDYADIFLAHFTSTEYHDVVQYIQSSNVVFIIFAVLVSLLLTNLLVGLAVDDIASVQDHAHVQRLALQVEGVLDMEYAMPEFIRRRWVAYERRVYPNEYAGRSSFIRWMLEETEMKEKNIRDTIAPPDNETEKLKAEISGLKKELFETSEVVKQISQQQLEASQHIADLTKCMQKLLDSQST